MNDGNKENSKLHGSDSKEKCPSGGENTHCGFFLETLSPTQGMLLAVYLANLISEGLTADQINIMGNFLTTVADLMLYRAAIVQSDDD